MPVCVWNWRRPSHHVGAALEAYSDAWAASTGKGCSGLEFNRFVLVFGSLAFVVGQSRQPTPTWSLRAIVDTDLTIGACSELLLGVLRRCKPGVLRAWDYGSGVAPSRRPTTISSFLVDATRLPGSSFASIEVMRRERLTGARGRMPCSRVVSLGFFARSSHFPWSSSMSTLALRMLGQQRPRAVVSGVRHRQRPQPRYHASRPVCASAVSTGLLNVAPAFPTTLICHARRMFRTHRMFRIDSSPPISVAVIRAAR